VVHAVAAAIDRNLSSAVHHKVEDTDSSEDGCLGRLVAILRIGGIVLHVLYQMENSPYGNSV
jgi:hypothetical protein